MYVYIFFNKVVDTLPSSPYLGQKKNLGLFGLHLDPLPPSRTPFLGIRHNLYKIRDLFKVKLYTIRSETKKKEREREIERETLNIY